MKQLNIKALHEPTASGHRSGDHVTRAGLDQAVSMHPAKNFASFDNETPRMLETLASLQIQNHENTRTRTHIK